MKNLLLTSYFNTKPDPQRGAYCAGGSLELVKTWLHSTKKVDANVVMFVDHSSSEFEDGVRGINPRVTFEYCKELQYSTNDSRFIFYNEYLKALYAEPAYVLMTDCFDVTFNNDPFDFMTLTGFPLYFGDDYAGPIKLGDWMYELSRTIYGRYVLTDAPLCNAGVIGGGYSNIIKLLRLYTAEIIRWGRKGNCNMVALNQLLQTKYTPADYYRGVPFTSHFKQYEEADHTFYIIHK